MTRKLTVIAGVSLLLAAVLFIISPAWSFEKQTPSRIPEDYITRQPFDDFAQAGTYCAVFNDANEPALYYPAFDSGTGFAVYMEPDPAQCGQTLYPFKITDVHLYLYHNLIGFSWPVDIQVNVRGVMQGDKCLGPDPQGLLYSAAFTIPIDSSYGVIGRPMNLTLSTPFCVNQPFFLEILYLDQLAPGDSLPSLLMDDGSFAPDTCDNWFRWIDQQYYEWYDVWSELPGDAIIRATGYAGDEACADLWYWKPDKPAGDPPAPSGMPDFDQNQAPWVAYCGPVAAANCLWWFGAVPPGWSPPQLVDTLARYFQTTSQGTNVYLMQQGLDEYFQDYQFAFTESTFEMPDFFEMEDSLKKCQDIILLLGFWVWDGAWFREGGHFVTMAGVCSESLKIAVSDPNQDAAETGWPGRVRPPHAPHPGDALLHNDPAFVSHDIYNSILDPPFPSPGNPFWEIDYEWPVGKFSGMNVPEKFKAFSSPAPIGGQQDSVTEVEFAVMICPTPPNAVEEGEEDATALRGFELDQNYPNPFNNETVIKFNLQRPAEVSLAIYNILGQKVRTLLERRLRAGPQSVVWDGKDEKGTDLSSGIYFYQLKVGDLKETKRLVLLK